MARITDSATVLLVADVVKSAAYFRDCVGFGEPDLFGEPPVFAILGRDGFYLMLARVDDPSKIVPHWKLRDEETWDLYFWVDDVEAIYAELKGRGAKIGCEMCVQPYGCKEFAIRDLESHSIGFGQVLKQGENA